MNPNLAKLQPCPFEKLRLLFKDIAPDPRYAPIKLGIGEPKHPALEFIRPASMQSLSGLAASVAAWGDETHVAENRRPMENTVCTARSSSSDVDAKTRAKTGINALLRGD